jgi:glyoxylase-like metal-dependent hydrolase (beta-lactamase superfamily II)
MAQIAQPRQLADDVFEVHVLGARVWLLAGESLTLVDTGTRGSGRAIHSAIRRLGRHPDELALIVLTHYHPDHVGALPELLAARSSPAVAIHATEAPFLAAPATLPNPFQTPRLRTAVRPVWPLVRLRRACAVDVPLADGDPLPGRPDVRVVHLPGHTRGSIALHLPAHGLVLGGDAFERRGGQLGPPNALYTEDAAAADASIRRLGALEFDALALSHWTPIGRRAAASVRALADQL